MRLATLLFVIPTLALAGCGGGDSSGGGSVAQKCVDSFNAAGNGEAQSIAGAIPTLEAHGDDMYTVGTWPKGDEVVPVWGASTAQKPTGKATVSTGDCVVLAPEKSDVAEGFFEDGGKWNFAEQEVGGGHWPTQARRAIADPKEATADSVGKLTLK